MSPGRWVGGKKKNTHDTGRCVVNVYGTNRLLSHASAPSLAPPLPLPSSPNKRRQPPWWICFASRRSGKRAGQTERREIDRINGKSKANPTNQMQIIKCKYNNPSHGGERATGGGYGMQHPRAAVEEQQQHHHPRTGPARPAVAAAEIEDSSRSPPCPPVPARMPAAVQRQLAGRATTRRLDAAGPSPRGRSSRPSAQAAGPR